MALRLTQHVTKSAEGESGALDVIDDLVATGHRIEQVREEGGELIEAMTLLDRLLICNKQDPTTGR